MKLQIYIITAQYLPRYNQPINSRMQTFVHFVFFVVAKTN